MLPLAFLFLAAAAPAHVTHLPRGTIATASGLRIHTLKPGAGPRPGPDDAVLIDYVGRLQSGKVFDQAKHAGMMVSGTVPGFGEALRLMQAGGTYRVWIPPRLAYGAEGGGGGIIPPNATLDFTITLVEIGRAAPPAPAQ
ncbi:MAG: peptidylprolyl isomerase [Alphaproteobacteria bacterium]|nr:peptidylprolyl isomerase [Alphaproteobacteria bacterium]